MTPSPPCLSPELAPHTDLDSPLKQSPLPTPPPPIPQQKPPFLTDFGLFQPPGICTCPGAPATCGEEHFDSPLPWSRCSSCCTFSVPGSCGKPELAPDLGVSPMSYFEAPSPHPCLLVPTQETPGPSSVPPLTMCSWAKPPLPSGPHLPPHQLPLPTLAPDSWPLAQRENCPCLFVACRVRVKPWPRPRRPQGAGIPPYLPPFLCFLTGTCSMTQQFHMCCFPCS